MASSTHLVDICQLTTALLFVRHSVPPFHSPHRHGASEALQGGSNERLHASRLLAVLGARSSWLLARPEPRTTERGPSRAGYQLSREAGSLRQGAGEDCPRSIQRCRRLLPAVDQGRRAAG